MQFPRQQMQGPRVAVTHRTRHRAQRSPGYPPLEKPPSRANGLGRVSGLSTCSATEAEGPEMFLQAAAGWARPCRRPGCVHPLLSWVSASLARPGSWRRSSPSRGLLALRCLGPAGLRDPKGTPCPGWPGLALVGTWCLRTALDNVPSGSGFAQGILWGHPTEAHSSHDTPSPGQADGPSDATGASLSLTCVSGTLSQGPP